MLTVGHEQFSSRDFAAFGPSVAALDNPFSRRPTFDEDIEVVEPDPTSDQSGKRGRKTTGSSSAASATIAGCVGLATPPAKVNPKATLSDAIDDSRTTLENTFRRAVASFKSTVAASAQKLVQVPKLEPLARLRSPESVCFKVWG